MQNVLKMLICSAVVGTFVPAQAASLILAAETGDQNFVERCINRGVDVNQVDDLGFTALYQACEHKKDRCALLLLENDADPTILPSSFSPSTPLNHATNHGSYPVVEAILRQVCKQNIDFDEAMELLSDEGSLSVESSDSVEATDEGVMSKSLQLSARLLPLVVQVIQKKGVLVRSTAEELARIKLETAEANNEPNVAVRRQIVDLLDLQTLGDRLPELLIQWFPTYFGR